MKASMEENEIMRLQKRYSTNGTARGSNQGYYEEQYPKIRMSSNNQTK